MKASLYFFIALPLLLSCLVLATDRAWGQSFDHSHKLWDEVLQSYVHTDGPESTVDYQSIKQRPEELLAYLAQIEGVTRLQFDAFSESQKLSFLINAYNAFTVKLIIDHYPVHSIRDIGGFFSSPWKLKFFTLFQKKQSLDHVEHELIRKDFREPRIHFALVCASKGCPALQDGAYIAEKLEVQLEHAATSFLKDSPRNRYDLEEKRFYLSKIFKWYGSDFIEVFGSVQAFVAPRMKVHLSPNLLEKVSVSYNNYNWSLNSKFGKVEQ